MSRPRFARVPRTVWDARLRSLSPCAQAVFFGLVAGPFASSVPGVVPAGAAAIAELVGCSTEAARAAFAELEVAGLIKVDAPALLVWVPDGPAWDPPSNRNVVTGWINQWPNLPKSPLLAEVRSALLDVVPRDLGRQAFEDATLLKPFPNGSGTHPKHVPTPSPSPSPPSPLPPKGEGRPNLELVTPTPKPTVNLEAIVEAWNEGVGSSGVCRADPPSEKTVKRDDMLRKAAKVFAPSDFRAAARALAQSSYHRGDDGGWAASLSWLLERGKGAKLEEWVSKGHAAQATASTPRPYRGVDLSAAGGDE